MFGLIQSAGLFSIGAMLVCIGLGVAKDLSRIPGAIIATVGLAIAGLAVSALADYPLWQSVLAVVMYASVGIGGVTFLVTKVPRFQQHPQEKE